MRSGCAFSSWGSSSMRTGTRCTTLIQLPVAFCAGSSAKAAPVPRPTPGNRAVVLDAAAVEIGHHLDRLPDAHARQLHFLEVGLHAQPLERHERHEGCARGDAVAELHVAPRHVAGYRGAHAGALQLSQARSTCVAAACTSGLSATPVRPTSAMLAARFFCAAVSASRAALSASRACPSSSLDTAPVAAQILAPIEVRLGAGQIRAALADHGQQLVAVGKHGARLAHGARQLLLGILQCDARVGGIERGSAPARR